MSSGEHNQPTEPLLTIIFSHLNLSLLHHVRRFVGDVLKAHPGRLAAAALSNITLTAHELLENALKYADNGETTLEVRTDLVGGKVQLRTTNRAASAHVARVASIIEGLTTKAPQAFYQELLAKTAEEKRGSGLGLARVVVECDMRLSHAYDGGVLSIDATCTPALVKAKRGRK